MAKEIGTADTTDCCSASGLVLALVAEIVVDAVGSLNEEDPPGGGRSGVVVPTTGETDAGGEMPDMELSSVVGFDRTTVGAAARLVAEGVSLLKDPTKFLAACRTHFAIDVCTDIACPAMRGDQT